MKKIKKFKIHLRQREIARLLKTTTKTEVTPQLEEAIQRECLRLQPLISPAAVYETQPKEKTPAELSAGAPDKWVAASSYIVTIGGEVEGEIREAQVRGEDILSQLLHAVTMEALEQTDNFVQRLIADEAKEDGCDLAGSRGIEGNDAWAAFSQILPGDKIGVQHIEENQFQPMYSAAGIVYWIPVKKKNQR